MLLLHYLKCYGVRRRGGVCQKLHEFAFLMVIYNFMKGVNYSITSKQNRLLKVRNKKNTILIIHSNKKAIWVFIDSFY